MQDPNEDTEWNDILRSKGILPPKEKEITEEAIVSMIEDTIQAKQKRKQQSNNDSDELEDSEDEEAILEYRRKRIAEIKKLASVPKFGSVLEITGQDYIQEVNNAGKDIWTALHLYKPGLPICTLINQHFQQLAIKFPYTKFIKSIAQTCVPNFPESNLPCIFVYLNGDMVSQLNGPTEFKGKNVTCDELEFILGKTGVIESQIKEDPRLKIKDKLFSDLEESMDW